MEVGHARASLVSTEAELARRVAETAALDRQVNREAKLDGHQLQHRH